METYIAVTKSGRNRYFSARSYSDAFQQATSWAGDDLLESFNVS